MLPEMKVLKNAYDVMREASQVIVSDEPPAKKRQIQQSLAAAAENLKEFARKIGPHFQQWPSDTEHWPI
jgi:hypothetical protein